MKEIVEIEPKIQALTDRERHDVFFFIVGYMGDDPKFKDALEAALWDLEREKKERNEFRKSKSTV